MLLDHEGLRADTARLWQIYIYIKIYFSRILDVDGALTWGYHYLMAFRSYSHEPNIILRISSVIRS